jgi:hypothetical protein
MWHCKAVATVAGHKNKAHVALPDSGHDGCHNTYTKDQARVALQDMAGHKRSTSQLHVNTLSYLPCQLSSVTWYKAQ